jgi:16S rRNA (uracil1498-N3)-methyltransferase
VERTDQPTVATLFADGELLEAGGSVTLGEDVAHHLRVRRLDVGAAVGLLDGAGRRASGTLVKLAKSQAVLSVERVEELDALPPVHLLVPVADRERMLWLAEKAAELGATSWRPVLWKRSRSVSPRGEGAGFQAKVRQRMIQAVTQSENPWTPTLFPDATPAAAAAATPTGTRLVLDVDGESIGRVDLRGPVSVAVGPEGGLERSELEALEQSGFRRVALAGHILRFETAAVAALAVVRAQLATTT